MNSMESNFVPYQIALDMKSIGFDEPCLALYVSLLDGSGEFELIKLEKQKNKLVLAPLYQQCFKWFENTYGLFVDRKTMCSVNEVMGMDYFIRSINGTWLVLFPADYSEFNSYKANTACVEKLIEIVKSRKV